jgi:hypothetical protein
MNIDLSPLEKAVDPLWRQVKLLFMEHHFLTILCGFFAVMMTLSFYRFLRSISPALVLFVLTLILAILVLHWTHTRTEPVVLRPFIDVVVPFFPAAPSAPPPILP